MKKVITLIAILASLFVFSEKASATTPTPLYRDNVVRPCGFHYGDDGWFNVSGGTNNSNTGSVNCTIKSFSDGRAQIVVDYRTPGWVPGHPVHQGAVEVWFLDTYCNPTFYDNGFLIKMTHWGSGCGINEASPTWIQNKPGEAFIGKFNGRSESFQGGWAHVFRGYPTNAITSRMMTHSHSFTKCTPYNAISPPVPTHGEIKSRPRGLNNNLSYIAQTQVYVRANEGGCWDGADTFIWLANIDLLPGQ